MFKQMFAASRMAQELSVSFYGPSRPLRSATFQIKIKGVLAIACMSAGLLALQAHAAGPRSLWHNLDRAIRLNDAGVAGEVLRALLGAGATRGTVENWLSSQTPPYPAGNRALIAVKDALCPASSAPAHPSQVPIKQPSYAHPSYAHPSTAGQSTPPAVLGALLMRSAADPKHRVPGLLLADLGRAIRADDEKPAALAPARPAPVSPSKPAPRVAAEQPTYVPAPARQQKPTPQVPTEQCQAKALTAAAGQSSTPAVVPEKVAVERKNIPGYLWHNLDRAISLNDEKTTVEALEALYHAYAAESDGAAALVFIDDVENWIGKQTPPYPARNVALNAIKAVLARKKAVLAEFDPIAVFEHQVSKNSAIDISKILIDEIQAQRKDIDSLQALLSTGKNQPEEAPLQERLSLSGMRIACCKKLIAEKINYRQADLAQESFASLSDKREEVAAIVQIF
jgi:hypothetical protein